MNLLRVSRAEFWFTGPAVATPWVIPQLLGPTCSVQRRLPPNIYAERSESTIEMNLAARGSNWLSPHFDSHCNPRDILAKRFARKSSSRSLKWAPKRVSICFR